ncbi:Ras-related protein Rab-34, isoform NARR [Frankliniella fusca]|uniref:Ras-related protein Rab-34, isoform NARR n=1 Tax=Frankliniella fusca TaxID=407009 RepID=A0AAE1HY63_9NEOP|nr:Ras-related protein Rab-34, isoform NARR [Frankliniella fusca]
MAMACPWAILAMTCPWPLLAMSCPWAALAMACPWAALAMACPWAVLAIAKKSHEQFTMAVWPMGKAFTLKDKKGRIDAAVINLPTLKIMGLYANPKNINQTLEKTFFISSHFNI